MEVQMCYAIQNPNSANYDYGTIGMCLLIIYSTALSVVLILKQPIEIIKEVVEEVVKVDVQTQVTKEEDEEVIEKEEEKTKKEEELLLANYNAKERALALQTAYEEQLNALIKKKLMKLETQVNFNDSYNRLYVSHYGNVLTTKQSLSNIIITHMQETLITDIKKLDKEIIIMAKKAGLFGENSDLLKEIEKLPDSTFVAEYKYIVSIM